MFGKKHSVKIKSAIVLITISLIFFQFIVISNNTIQTRAAVGKIVAFEESHMPMTSINTTNLSGEGPGRYYSFVEQLTNNSYTVETIDAGEILSQGNLQNYDIIVIVASVTTYTAEEITEIDTWVKNGGSLLLITEWSYHGNGMRTIFNNFGYDYPEEDGVRDSDDTVGNTLQFYIDRDNMVTHDITTGVNRIEVYAATGFNETATGATTLIDTDGNDTTTWNTGGIANNIPILSALTGGAAGNGKIVTITDYNLWDSLNDIDSDGDNDFFDSDNERLALNIITMLTLASIVFIKRKRK